jgi:hypothetical protein
VIQLVEKPINENKIQTPRNPAGSLSGLYGGWGMGDNRWIEMMPVRCVLGRGKSIEEQGDRKTLDGDLSSGRQP